MTQQGEPKDVSTSAESTVDVPNEPAVEPTGGLFADLQRERAEAEREETDARAGDDIKNAEYLRGRKDAFEFAIMKLSESGMRPVAADAYPAEEFTLSIEVSVNRKTGVVTSRIGGKWDDHDFKEAFELIAEAAGDIVNENPEEYITNPVPMTVRLRHDLVPATDNFGEPLMLSKSEAADSQFIFDDGRSITLRLSDDSVVRVGKLDVDVEQIEP